MKPRHKSWRVGARIIAEFAKRAIRLSPLVKNISHAYPLCKAPKRASGDGMPDDYDFLTLASREGERNRLRTIALSLYAIFLHLKRAELMDSPIGRPY
jgi:hypothetical protein